MDRADYADQLRNNPLLAEILRECEDDVVEAWKSAQSQEEREDKWQRFQAVQALSETVYARLADLRTNESSEA